MNIEMFLTAKEVEESLERQETATCLAWCHDNKSRLRKMKVAHFQILPHESKRFKLRPDKYLKALPMTNKKILHRFMSRI